MNLPQDVVPNICVRLAGPELLQLARVCKQTSINNQAMLKEWTSRELHELGGLGEEELWTRFLDLAANVADLIDSADWETFLHRVQARQEGYAVLMQLAVLTPAAGKVNEGPLSENYLLGPVLGAGEYAALVRLLADADENLWMARAGAAVITGLSRHVAVECEDFALGKLAGLFTDLPLAYQIKILPYLGSNRGTCNDIPTKMIVAANKAHAHCLHLHLLGSCSDVDHVVINEHYVARLGEILDDPALYRILSPVLTFIRAHPTPMLKQGQVMDP